jgi:NitT/TauT family transport system substrate-binding protein
LLSSSGEGKYTPQPARTLSKVLASTDYDSYIASGVVRNKNWKEKRIDFQPYPFPSYTEELVKQIKLTKIEGDNKFLDNLDPSFVAKDLVDDRFVKKSITAVGGPKVFDLPSNLIRKEVLSS